MSKGSRILVTVLFLTAVLGDLNASEKGLGRVILLEPAGLPRVLEYVEVALQTRLDISKHGPLSLVALDEANGEVIPCQVFGYRALEKERQLFSIIFPISLQANETREFTLKIAQSRSAKAETDLALTGSGFEIRVENRYFVADLTKSAKAEEKNYESGQIKELLIKMGFDQLLTNAEDRIHWAPNFKRPELEYYKTIAHWQAPKFYEMEQGSYLIQTKRRDKAPYHPEIMLTAVYKFYANLPYFKFFSNMEIVQDVWLELLRNEEMTMDSMFTHVAFQRPDGEIVYLPIEERHSYLKEKPIEDDAHWLCFYHIDKGFGFGNIRLKYDNSNAFGADSPTFAPFTQIGQWLDRRYWNRRLIHDRLTFVPKGSRYLEENAYLVFKVDPDDPVQNIKYWAQRLRSPVRIKMKSS